MMEQLTRYTQTQVVMAMAWAGMGKNVLYVIPPDAEKRGAIAAYAKSFIPIVMRFPVLVQPVEEGIEMVPIRESMMLPEKPSLYTFKRGEDVGFSVLRHLRPGQIIDCGVAEIAPLDIRRHMGQCWWK